MAWRSSGTNNDEMVDNLKRFGVIRSEPVEEAFRAVDRRFFVPQNLLELAHLDRPLKEGNVHISAPHIYGCIVESLNIAPNSSLSFLNIGSGTGYLSSIVANILGKSGVCYGVELHREAVDHCMASTERWKADNGPMNLPLMEFVHGNGFNIDTTTGESRFGYDRIYVGASVEKRNLAQLAELLRPGGVLVAPVDDKLVKVLRIRKSESPAAPAPPRSFRGRPPPLSEDFSQQTISGVHFAPLVNDPAIKTVIHSRVWEPSVHHNYPESFQKSCKEILLCSRASSRQPPPVVEKERINVASKIPRALWMEVLSYTHRDWFESPRAEEDLLRQRLGEAERAAQQAREAKREAETRLKLMERERDGYRLLALRLQTRLESVMGQRNGENNDGDTTLSMEDISRAASTLYNNETNLLRVGGINAILRQFQEDASDIENDEEEEEDAQDDANMDAESDDDGDNHDGVDDASSTAMEDATEEAEIDAVMAVAPTASSGMHFRQAKAVSISGTNL